MSFLQVKNLTKKFDRQIAVNDLSFTVDKGEIVGFLGPNGAGKSTTMKIITGFTSPTSGSVDVMGVDVQKSPLKVKQQIGYLPEHNPLYGDLYVREYLAFVGRIHQLNGSKLKKRIDDIISLVGLTKEQNKKISYLSKGYKQRVGLAQALLHNPKVLILDEPTSGLDPNQLSEIRAVIKKISSEKTVIFSTHIMQEVKALCDRLIIINDGKLIIDDKIENISIPTEKRKISVEFKNPVEKVFFSNIEGIEELQRKNQTSFDIYSNTNSDIRPAIFKKAVELNQIILEMKSEEIPLENIFHKLTTKA